ncbi:unnamed protein product [Prorocentrum cordatum]|uniref:Uncharacterized protein n=1 Tax=Prorocentrum cordatum TaxID=2364126 RepID=A0ABN9WP47_9DINO|nr:unnamed protein product [Polarella glacialis]
MRMSRITQYTEQWVYWYPNQHTFNMYYGPESHKENPDFPAPSGGWPAPGGPYDIPMYTAKKAVSGWAPAQLSASVGRQGRSGGFAGGSARAFGSAKRSVAAMRAHKMAASSTKNQGGGTNIPKWVGVQHSGFQGNAVKAGTLLVRQTGVKWATAGGGVKMTRSSEEEDRDGIVQWRGSPGTKAEGGKGEVSVVPWEYVRAKCEWAVDESNECTLVYKEYKPWMGTHMHDKTATFNGAKNGLRRKIMAQKRKIWEESPEGQEHLKKKQEKREKQKAINAKWRAYRTAKREEKAKEAVDK